MDLKKYMNIKEFLKNELETIRKQILVSKARLSLLEELENIIIRALKLKE